mmetsp:Transcript_15422/g.39274  ORF Transcript_15422/g.39274 Transcript_15422/m.39274 type:complete len:295 (-) Transcript_15422:647-1531(-)
MRSPMKFSTPVVTILEGRGCLSISARYSAKRPIDSPPCGPFPEGPDEPFPPPRPPDPPPVLPPPFDPLPPQAPRDSLAAPSRLKRRQCWPLLAGAGWSVSPILAFLPFPLPALLASFLAPRSPPLVALSQCPFLASVSPRHLPSAEASVFLLTVRCAAFLARSKFAFPLATPFAAHLCTGLSTIPCIAPPSPPSPSPSPFPSPCFSPCFSLFPSPCPFPASCPPPSCPPPSYRPHSAPRPVASWRCCRFQCRRPSRAQCAMETPVSSSHCYCLRRHRRRRPSRTQHEEQRRGEV